ncbi:MAG: signal peptidase I [Patescibacteria group bacterium]
MNNERGNIVFGVFWEFLEAIVFAAAIFTIVYLFVFQPNQVSGNSMYPTFHDKEYILTDKVSYRLSQPGRDDVVVFKSPPNPEKDYIKRIIAIPGDSVMVKLGKVYLNGELLSEDFLPPDVYTQANTFLREGEGYTVPSDSYIVMGDNRGGSDDSRHWGVVTKGEFIGKVFFRYLPITRFGMTPR